MAIPTDSQIIELTRDKSRPWLSLEFFPPKTEAGLQNLFYNAQLLTAAKPDFVTVTWGAGGSTREKTLEVCRGLHRAGLDPVMPHLTCVGASKSELRDIVQEIHSLGFRNIMTLRGDPPKGNQEFQPHPDGLRNAAGLVELIKEVQPDVCCGVAGYPEGHPESPTARADIDFLKEKVDVGGDFITTQLFYDNDLYFNFFDRCRTAGIDCLVLPGVLPVVSLKQLDRITSLCGASVPSALSDRLQACNGDEDEMAKAGLDWTVNQINDLLDAGAPGVHLYILNDSKAALSRQLLETFHRIQSPSS